MQCLKPQASSLKPQASSLKVKYNKSIAFTLTELLITLGIIGLIATFTIPSVIKNIDEAQNNAKAKETISILSQLTAEAMMSGVNRGVDFPNFVASKLNTESVCLTATPTDGCLESVLTSGSLTYIQLHNGVMIDFSGYFETFGSWLVIDVNGVNKPPNLEGEDRFWLCYNVSEADKTQYDWGLIKRGTIVPCANHTTSVAKYNALFSNG
jgi:prepilin-type N-terminal cleavage/methylation domain-containing protein